MKLKKFLSVLLAVVLIACMGIITASAETVKIAPEVRNPTINQEFTITITFSGAKLGSIDASVSYDANRLQLLSVAADSSNPSKGEIIISHYNANGFSSKSFEYKFKAIAEGDAKVAVKYSEVWSADASTKYTPNGSTTITITDKSKLSGNANLKAFALSDDIPLNPAFSKDVTTYNVEVDNSVEKVLLNAIAEDIEAKITYGGSTRMKVGDNQRWVVVTAPNGTQKKYIVNIKRAAPDGAISDLPVNLYEVQIEGKAWNVASEYTPEMILPGFTISSTTINGYELPALKSETTQDVVVYAKPAGEEAGGAYFSYNPLTAVFKQFRLYTSTVNSLILLDIDEGVALPHGYYKANANIGGYDVKIIKYENEIFADFVIVYAQTSLGNKDYYRIDLKENTVQRLPEFAAALEKAAVMERGTIITRFAALSLYEQIMVCAVAFALLLAIVLIILLLIRLVRGVAYKKSEMVNELDELEEFDDFIDEEVVDTQDDEEDF